MFHITSKVGPVLVCSYISSDNIVHFALVLKLVLCWQVCFVH